MKWLSFLNRWLIRNSTLLLVWSFIFNLFCFADRRIGDSRQKQYSAVVPAMATRGLHNDGSRLVRVHRRLYRNSCRRSVAYDKSEYVALVRALRRRPELHARQDLQRVARLKGRWLLQEDKLPSMVSDQRILI